jgi:hypothetical protein
MRSSGVLLACAFSGCPPRTESECWGGLSFQSLLAMAMAGEARDGRKGSDHRRDDGKGKRQTSKQHPGWPAVVQCVSPQRGLHRGVPLAAHVTAQNTPTEPPERRGRCERHKRGCGEIQTFLVFEKPLKQEQPQSLMVGVLPPCGSLAAETQASYHWAVPIPPDDGLSFCGASQSIATTSGCSDEKEEKKACFFSHP